jgi:Ser/Thr protein kinase RdoA (MazF antagonist)
MEKVVFSVAGRQFNVELEDAFAQYIKQDLFDNNVVSDRDSEPTKILQLYLKSMKKNFDNEEQIRTFMVENFLNR